MSKLRPIRTSNAETINAAFRLTCIAKIDNNQIAVATNATPKTFLIVTIQAPGFGNLSVKPGKAEIIR